jgi:hypothetical protein
MNIKDINSAIMFGNFTNDELTSIINAVQYAREQLRKTKIRAFKAGDAVKFTSAKRGGLAVTGTVTKVAIKYVTVKDGGMLWRVPANMLEAV